MVMVGAPLARASAWVFYRGTPIFDLEIFPVVADSLAAGCLLACRRSWLEGQGWYLRLFRAPVAILLLAIVIVVNGLVRYQIVYPFGMTIINLGIAVLVHRCVYHWDSGVGRALNWRPFASIGVFSYSLYLWQQLFLNRYSSGFQAAFPQNLMFACAAAMLSYFVLEKPLMSLRHRLRAA
jgi:peptidoglycan/LPS O-acetylase OafA/YrhL